nr:MAG TPA: hypothetical protein [Caudoviricetes sp.]
MVDVQFFTLRIFYLGPLVIRVYMGFEIVMF